MNIPGINSVDPLSYGPAQGSNQANEDTFMQLLVTQLKNQDPLSPTQNEDFIAQLATFTSVEELESLNDNIVAMIALNQSNALLSQMTQSSALIGKNVAWTDPVTGEERQGTVGSVRIEDGVALLRIEGEDIPLAAVGEILGEGMLEESGEAADDASEETQG